MRIVEAVATEFDMTADDLLGSDRHKSTSLARQVACYLLRVKLRRSFPEVGYAMGVNQRTVRDAMARVEKWLAEDWGRERMNAIEERIADV